MSLEQEVKLAYPDAGSARAAIAAAGGTITTARRLLDDRLFDTHDLTLRQAGQGLRVRRDGAQCVLTWKGPTQPGAVKTREEIETGCDDADVMTGILGALGYVPVFRAQKFREEYAIGTATVTVDETPFGVWVEVEAAPDDISDVVARLGRSEADYELRSYVSLWREWCATRHVAFGDMVFGAPAAIPADGAAPVRATG